MTPPGNGRHGRCRLARVVLAIEAAVVLIGGLLGASIGAAEEPHRVGPIGEAEQRDVLARIAAVGRRGFLYEVARPASGETVAPTRLYLYGTIHLGRAGSEPFNVPVVQALRRSRRLALEADPTDMTAIESLALELGRYGDDDGLPRHVSPALLARVRAFGDRNGLPGERIERFKPWLLANMVALSEVDRAGLDADLGAEFYLSGYARSAGLPIVEVEGLEAQLRLLASLPDAMQTAQLDEALADLASGDARSQTRSLFDLWSSGDRRAGDALVAQMHGDADGRAFERYFIDRLIDERNRSMADKAERYLEGPGDTFFAVGSLHLFGEGGLIHEFERRGYRVVDLQPASVATR